MALRQRSVGKSLSSNAGGSFSRKETDKLHSWNERPQLMVLLLTLSFCIIMVIMALGRRNRFQNENRTIQKGCYERFCCMLILCLKFPIRQEQYSPTSAFVEQVIYCSLED